MRKNYVHIKFQPFRCKAQWYWAIQLKPQVFKRVRKDGDECIKETVRKDGSIVCTEQMLVGEPIEIRKAAMNLHYAELEEI